MIKSLISAFIILLLLVGCASSKVSKLPFEDWIPMIPNEDGYYEMDVKKQDAGNGVVSVRLPDGTINIYRTITTTPQWEAYGYTYLQEYLNVKDTLAWITKYNERRKYDYIENIDPVKGRLPSTKVPNILGPKKIISYKVGTTERKRAPNGKLIVETFPSVTLKLMSISLYERYLRDLNYKQLHQDTKTSYLDEKIGEIEPELSKLFKRYPSINSFNKFSREQLDDLYLNKTDTCLNGDCVNGKGELLYGGVGRIISNFKDGIPYGPGVWVDIPDKYYRSLAVIEGVFAGFNMSRGTIYLCDIRFTQDGLSSIKPFISMSGQLKYDVLPLRSTVTVIPPLGDPFEYNGEDFVNKSMTIKDLAEVAIFNLYGMEGKQRIYPDYYNSQLNPAHIPKKFPFELKLMINNGSDLSKIRIDKDIKGAIVYSIFEEDYWGKMMREKLNAKNFYNIFEHCFQGTSTLSLSLVPYQNKVGLKEGFGDVTIAVKKVGSGSSSKFSYNTYFDAREWLGRENGRDFYNKGTDTYKTEKKEEISNYDVYEMECRCNGEVVATVRGSKPTDLFENNNWLSIGEEFQGSYDKTISILNEVVRNRLCKFWLKENLEKAKQESDLAFQDAQKSFDEQKYEDALTAACKAFKIREDNAYYLMMEKALKKGITLNDKK